MSSGEWMSEEEEKRDTLKLIIAEIKLVAHPVGKTMKQTQPELESTAIYYLPTT